ncbi:maltodextrin glucosidase [Aquincola sp. S2]|uniref:Maltodextrin glucosidase n=1 Tax=Pseudaquabacterium terrae TaxID=2732868 RepID=A0ABX2ETM8_9BURK|nr:maltodextrin glucosidase [Aquabacterium terrae]NRF72107.1 maltodextrin glucosidase [Aquabacterium terrae]
MLLLHPPIAPWLVRTETGCRVTLLTDQPALQAVWLRVLPDNEEYLLPMKAAGRAGALHAWTGEMPWDGGNPATLYSFEVLAGDSQRWLGADGLHPHVPPEAQHFRVVRELPPAWVRDQVFYQVFPDRFALGDSPPNRDGETVYGSRPQAAQQLEWGAPLDPAQAANSFYGGDLDGLRAKLGHLQQAVGATAVYLNPVFTSGSNHRYDTEDYDNVDPALGGNAALERLSAAMHSRGMRLVLDAVLNHTSTNHPWFNRWGRHEGVGADQSDASPWRQWYAFNDAGHPIYWKGHDSLPVLDFSHAALREAVYEGPDAIVKKWLRAPYSIDGWRLDVIHMLGEGRGARNNAHHVRQIRQAIKSEQPSAYMLGEHFSEATRWLQGDQEDASMNYYGFAQPLWAWLAGQDVNGHPAALSTLQFEAWLNRARSAIGYDTALVQFNLLGSHDTPRFLTRLAGNHAKARLGMTLLFAYPGVPCLYYGDEVGMEGGADPDCRRCMDWTGASWDRELLAHVKRLATLRRERREWRDGAFQVLAQGEHWLAFARYTAQAVSIVVVNRGPAIEVQLPLKALPVEVSEWRDADGAPLTARSATLSLTLPAESGRVLVS